MRIFSKPLWQRLFADCRAARHLVHLRFEFRKFGNSFGRFESTKVNRVDSLTGIQVDAPLSNANPVGNRLALNFELLLKKGS